MREIRTRIRTVKNIEKITRAMKLVAAARLKKAQDRVAAARPYAEMMEQMMRQLSTVGREFSHPLLQVRPERNIGVILITVVLLQAGKSIERVLERLSWGMVVMIFAFLLFVNLRYVPRSVWQTTMSGFLTVGALPEDVDLVIVPGLAFDERGGRLGRGAGFYDRVLGGLRPGAWKIAVAFECQIVESVPMEEHDQRVHAIVTERRVIDVSRPG